jgi:hypothetical protein
MRVKTSSIFIGISLVVGFVVFVVVYLKSSPATSSTGSQRVAPKSASGLVLADFPERAIAGISAGQRDALVRDTEATLSVYLSNNLPEMLSHLRAQRQSAPSQWDDPEIIKTWYARHEWFFSSFRVVEGEVGVFPVLANGVTHAPATLAEKVNYSEQANLTGLPFQKSGESRRLVYEVQVPTEYTFTDGVNQRVRFGLLMEWDPVRTAWIPIGTRFYDIPVGKPAPNVP